jgi:trehalose 6-phosphate synthase/phosphatase
MQEKGMHDGRLIIVSNRLPLTVDVREGHPTVRRSVGGLATGLRGPHERSGGVWIGWPGDLNSLTPDARRGVDAQLADIGAVPVDLSAHEIEVFYGEISNAVLWAICHDRIDRLPVRVAGWETYEAANARFADAVAEQWRPGDMIWVHDYQLLRVPALLRERLPEARIGFFLHIPFPNPEVFFTLSTRTWLVEGMLGADLVGFHTRRYRGHFTAALRRLLGIEMDADEHISYGGRRIRLGIFPMGVDAADFASRSASREVSGQTLALKTNPQRLIVGIDRLDYSKGISRRLVSFERLLVQHPEWRERVRLVQVAVPSRGTVKEYRSFRREVEAMVGRINGEFATPTWTPIHYLFQSVAPETLLALYRAADVLLVTPLRDGMNLVAKEFAASRIDEDGVLILSEFAGAVDELRDALVVNPYDVDGVADAIHQALTMDRAERRLRMTHLRRQVLEHDVHRWADNFVDTLADCGHTPAPVVAR